MKMDPKLVLERLKADLCRISGIKTHRWHDIENAKQYALRMTQNMTHYMPILVTEHMLHVTGIQMMMEFFSRKRPHLTSCPEVDYFSTMLFRHCARVILDEKFSCLGDNHRLPLSMRATLGFCRTQLTSAGLHHRMEILLWLLDNHWIQPTLSDMVTGRLVKPEQAFQYLERCESPELYRIRIEVLIECNCLEFALNLCHWCVHFPTMRENNFFQRAYLRLLAQNNRSDLLSQKCEQLGCCTCCQLLHQLDQDTPPCPLAAKHRIVDVLLIRDMKQNIKHCCSLNLVRRWLELRRRLDGNDYDFLKHVEAFARSVSDTRYLNYIADALGTQDGMEFVHFRIGLLARAFEIALRLQLEQGHGRKLAPTAFLPIILDLFTLCAKLCPQFLRGSCLLLFLHSPTQQNFDMLTQVAASRAATTNFEEPTEPIGDTLQYKLESSDSDNVVYESGGDHLILPAEKCLCMLGQGPHDLLFNSLRLLSPPGLDPTLPWCQIKPLCVQVLQGVDLCDTSSQNYGNKIESEVISGDIELEPDSTKGSEGIALEVSMDSTEAESTETGVTSERTSVSENTESQGSSGYEPDVDYLSSTSTVFSPYQRKHSMSNAQTLFVQPKRGENENNVANLNCSRVKNCSAVVTYDNMDSHEIMEIGPATPSDDSIDSDDQPLSEIKKSKLQRVACSCTSTSDGAPCLSCYYSDKSGCQTITSDPPNIEMEMPEAASSCVCHTTSKGVAQGEKTLSVIVQSDAQRNCDTTCSVGVSHHIPSSHSQYREHGASDVDASVCSRPSSGPPPDLSCYVEYRHKNASSDDASSDESAPSSVVATRMINQGVTKIDEESPKNSDASSKTPPELSCYSDYRERRSSDDSSAENTSSLCNVEKALDDISALNARKTIEIAGPKTKMVCMDLKESENSAKYREQLPTNDDVSDSLSTSSVEMETQTCRKRNQLNREVLFGVPTKHNLPQQRTGTSSLPKLRDDSFSQITARGPKPSKRASKVRNSHWRNVFTHQTGRGMRKSFDEIFPRSIKDYSRANRKSSRMGPDKVGKDSQGAYTKWGTDSEDESESSEAFGNIICETKTRGMKEAESQSANAFVFFDKSMSVLSVKEVPKESSQLGNEPTGDRMKLLNKKQISGTVTDCKPSLEKSNRKDCVVLLEDCQRRKSSTPPVMTNEGDGRVSLQTIDFSALDLACTQNQDKNDGHKSSERKTSKFDFEEGKNDDSANKLPTPSSTKPVVLENASQGKENRVRDINNNGRTASTLLNASRGDSASTSKCEDIKVGQTEFKREPHKKNVQSKDRIPQFSAEVTVCSASGSDVECERDSWMNDVEPLNCSIADGSAVIMADILKDISFEGVLGEDIVVNASPKTSESNKGNDTEENKSTRQRTRTDPEISQPECFHHVEEKKSQGLDESIEAGSSKAAISDQEHKDDDEVRAVLDNTISLVLSKIDTEKSRQCALDEAESHETTDSPTKEKEPESLSSSCSVSQNQEFSELLSKDETADMHCSSIIDVPLNDGIKGSENKNIENSSERSNDGQTDMATKEDVAMCIPLVNVEATDVSAGDDLVGTEKEGNGFDTSNTKQGNASETSSQEDSVKLPSQKDLSEEKNSECSSPSEGKICDDEITYKGETTELSQGYSIPNEEMNKCSPIENVSRTCGESGSKKEEIAKLCDILPSDSKCVIRADEYQRNKKRYGREDKQHKVTATLSIPLMIGCGKEQCTESKLATTSSNEEMNGQQCSVKQADEAKQIPTDNICQPVEVEAHQSGSNENLVRDHTSELSVVKEKLLGAVTDETQSKTKLSGNGEVKVVLPIHPQQQITSPVEVMSIETCSPADKHPVELPADDAEAPSSDELDLQPPDECEDPVMRNEPEERVASPVARVLQIGDMVQGSVQDQASHIEACVPLVHETKAELPTDKAKGSCDSVQVSDVEKHANSDVLSKKISLQNYSCVATGRAYLVNDEKSSSVKLDKILVRTTNANKNKSETKAISAEMFKEQLSQNNANCKLVVVQDVSKQSKVMFGPFLDTDKSKIEVKMPSNGKRKSSSEGQSSKRIKLYLPMPHEGKEILYGIHCDLVEVADQKGNIINENQVIQRPSPDGPRGSSEKRKFFRSSRKTQISLQTHPNSISSMKFDPKKLLRSRSSSNSPSLMPNDSLLIVKQRTESPDIPLIEDDNQDPFVATRSSVEILEEKSTAAVTCNLSEVHSKDQAMKRELHVAKDRSSDQLVAKTSTHRQSLDSPIRCTRSSFKRSSFGQRITRSSLKKRSPDASVRKNSAKRKSTDGRLVSNRRKTVALGEVMNVDLARSARKKLVRKHVPEIVSEKKFVGHSISEISSNKVLKQTIPLSSSNDAAVLGSSSDARSAVCKKAEWWIQKNGAQFCPIKTYSNRVKSGSDKSATCLLSSHETSASGEKDLQLLPSVSNQLLATNQSESLTKQSDKFVISKLMRKCPLVKYNAMIGFWQCLQCDWYSYISPRTTLKHIFEKHPESRAARFLLKHVDKT